MSQTPLLSIVAAVYNGEKFLAQFFECIEQQQLDSYELILVNDGSTDNSLAVIAEWQERLQNVQVLEQENQGVSVARNTGLAAASGKYLAFPDIDDKLYPGMYRTLLEMAEKEHLDIATCNGTYVYEKRRESHPIFPLDRLPSTDVLPGHVWLKQALDSRKFLHVTWLNIYRSESNGVARYNPLGKVPALVTDDGECWFDSPVIAQYLELLGVAPPMIPADPRAALRMRQLEALADGVMEAAQALVREKARPGAQQSEQELLRQREKVARGLDRLEACAADGMLRGDEVNLATISTACAIAYLNFRRVAPGWCATRPQLVKLVDALFQRASFARTEPPRT